MPTPPTDSIQIGAMTDGVSAQLTDAVPAKRGAGNVYLTLSYIKNLVLSGLTLAWGSITGTPTTRSGYGITDAAPNNATYITQTANGELSAEQALSGLATGYVKNTTGTGVLSVQAVPIPVADGGSNATTAAGARTSFGAAPLDAQYVALATNAELSNERVLAVDASLVLTDSGAGSNVTIAQTTRSRRAILFSEEFCDNPKLATRVSGGTATIDNSSNTDTTGSHPGNGVVTTGAGTSGRGAFGHTTNDPAMILFGGGAVTVDMDVQVVTLSDGTDTFTVRLGFNDSAGSDGADSVMFRYTHSVNGGRWECVTRSNSVETATDSGVAVSAGTYVRLSFTINAAATSVAFSVNGSVVQTHVANIPSGAGRQTAPMFEIAKSAGTNSRTLLLDYVEGYQDFTTPR